eukprot:snap_masked-scaffold63_size435493-processed-gene-3.3 protein:Tk00832 transcript:snap_masked-scaffold63_size435493-processed-gene-3.3-mRNA-1 annotation:"GA22559"
MMSKLTTLAFVVLGIASTWAFDCQGQEGLVGDPQNCQLFYQCVYDRPPFLNECPPGTLFDEIRHLCDFADQVDCGDRPRPDGMTTTTAGSTGPTDPNETTTTSTTTTTTRGSTPTPGPSRFPNKVLGLYLALADESAEGDFGTDSVWEPRLYEYQQTGANVLFFTFINPSDMKVPVSFQNLAATKGTGVEGAIPEDTLVLFAVGGYLYSFETNPWDWLTTPEKAVAMAEIVAEWPSLYGCDGIDLDIEEGAGAQVEAGPNLVVFIRKLKELQPDMIVSQPTYGFPQVQAETDVINASWNPDSSSNYLADSIGIMTYEGTEALRYVDNFALGSQQWDGFPIRVNVPRPKIMVGCKGSANQGTISTLATESVNQNLLGIMVWYVSVKNGFQYDESWDASFQDESKQAYIDAMALLALDEGRDGKDGRAVRLTCGTPLRLLTWNSSNLGRGRTKELALSHLLFTNTVDVAVITEAELDEASASVFAIAGYNTLLPTTSPGSKVRVLALVKTELALKSSAKLMSDIMLAGGLSVWVELTLPRENLLVGGVYRQWSGTNELTDLTTILDQCKVATVSNRNVVVLGVFNLDLHRRFDVKYSRRGLLQTWLEGVEEAGFENLETGPTWRSHGAFANGTTDDGKRSACLDHATPVPASPPTSLSLVMQQLTIALFSQKCSG